jgi:hypothetical protein
MASDFVQVQADGPGKKVQTFKNTIGPDDVEAQAVVAVDATGAPISPALDATLTSGAQKAIARGGAKGATAAADITSTPSGANHQGQDVVLYDASGNLIDPRSIRALTSADVVDVSDRAARLIGRVYGSQGQQLTQTPTNFNLQVEAAVGGALIDPRSIRALTSADVVTAAQGTAGAIAAAWPVKPTDGTNSQAFTTASEGKVNAPDATVGPSNLSASGQVTLQLGGNKASAGIDLTGTWVGTFTFEATIDGSNWFQITAFGALSGLAFQNTTVNSHFVFAVGGYQAIRANLAWTSGTATVVIRASAGPIGDGFTFARIQDPTSNGPIAGVSAKGTQASGFLGVQEAKDSGRVNIAWTAEVAGAATTEGLLTVTESRDGARRRRSRRRSLPAGSGCASRQSRSPSRRSAPAPLRSGAICGSASTRPAP